MWNSPINKSIHFIRKKLNTTESLNFVNRAAILELPRFSAGLNIDPQKNKHTDREEMKECLMDVFVDLLANKTIPFIRARINTTES